MLEEEINFPLHIWIKIISSLEHYEMIYKMEILKRGKK